MLTQFVACTKSDRNVNLRHLETISDFSIICALGLACVLGFQT